MEKDLAIKKALFWMKYEGIIKPEHAERARVYFNDLYGIAQENRIVDVQRRNERKVVAFRYGKKIDEYRSIRAAAAACGYGKRYRGGESLVLNVLSGRHPHTKEGYYFEYADRQGDDINTDTGLSDLPKEAVGAHNKESEEA